MPRPDVNAILVSVDYTDLLRITLPWNRHHFRRVLVVTSPGDEYNVRPVAQAAGAEVYVTDAFYRHGATFNKWAALEEGLDVLGRTGWLCLMDADVLWSKEASLEGYLTKGMLLTPLRRMLDNLAGLTTLDPTTREPTLVVPAEDTWGLYPVHRNVGEWAGYSQVFHAEDPHLPPAPWHETNWKHAGGADSFFQLLWPPVCKVRPPWQCLHLGPAGQNWHGRATAYLDGTCHPQAAQRHRATQAMWHGRRGRMGTDKFQDERLR